MPKLSKSEKPKNICVCDFECFPDDGYQLPENALKRGVYISRCP